MLKVLFIDDQPESVETVREELKEKIAGVQSEVDNFNNAEFPLTSFLPDIVVLDIFRGQVADEDTAGLPVHDYIWNECFCPIVIYSARPDDVAGRVKEHPFVKMVRKGANSEEQVVACIEEFLPHVEALNKVQADIRQHVNKELQNVAPRVFKAIDETDKRKTVFVRSAKRRIAAMMDEPHTGNIMSWEQYLCPAVGSSLLTGDVIRRTGSDGNNPTDHFVVLSPSCDLECVPGERAANVDKVLVSSCSPIQNALGEVNVSVKTREDKFKDKLLVLLRRGFGTRCVPLPELPGILPAMTLELKKLELIQLEQIGDGEECQYYRVASIDSPFRELLAWAYLQIAGRPGLPSRDFEGWASDIYRCVTELDQGQNT